MSLMAEHRQLRQLNVLIQQTMFYLYFAAEIDIAHFASSRSQVAQSKRKENIQICIMFTMR